MSNRVSGAPARPLNFGVCSDGVRVNSSVYENPGFEVVVAR